MHVSLAIGNIFSWEMIENCSILRVLRALPTLPAPARGLGLPSPCPQSRAPWQPQWHCSRAGFWLPTALPCPVMGPTKLSPPVGPHPSLAPSCPCPCGGAQCLGLGLLPVSLIAPWWYPREPLMLLALRELPVFDSP